MEKLTSTDESFEKWSRPFDTNATVQYSSTSEFADIGLDQLKKQCYQEGYTAAQSELNSAFETKLNTAVSEAVNAEKNQIKQLVESLTQVDQSLTDEIKKSLERFALKIAEHICRKKLTDDTETYVKLINDAVSENT